MIQINECRIPISNKTAQYKQLEMKICSILHLKSDCFTWQIRRRSIDARKKPEIYYVYTLWVRASDERKLAKTLHNPKVQIVEEKSYPGTDTGVFRINRGSCRDFSPPVIIGDGPAGLFAAYLLTEYGCPPLVIERGRPVGERKKDVDLFWHTGILDPNSNVQFGEGGAGTFSDGKLNTSDKDRTGRIRYVLETFVRFGASGEILYEQKPHVGTDVLAEVITAMRIYLESKGCRFLFETKAEDFTFSDGMLKEIICSSKGVRQIIPAECAVLAIGHSSRDTFKMLKDHGIPMEHKNFAVGFRIEHPQQMMDEALYGRENAGKLPAAPYKLTSNFTNGRSVYSFCMCPGGYVVNASSNPGQTAVNGMSYAARNGANANSAIVVSVGGQDFYAAGEHVTADSVCPGNDPLAGMYYQIKLEESVYSLGNGAIAQQLYGDFKMNRASASYGAFESQTKGSRIFSNLRGIFSDEIESSFLQGMEHFAKIIPGFDRDDAILSGVESRTSSPVRILRGDDLQSMAVKGLYPCGEGAGYAGGIVSAAVDGLRVAEAILRSHN